MGERPVRAPEHLRGPSLAVVGALVVLAVGYAALTFRPGSIAYLDYVDGYYLYVAHRMAQGVVLYSGVMGVQPPGIYVVGDIIFRLHDSLAAIRLYAVVVHCLTMLLVFLTAKRVYGRNSAALLAAALYSLAPYGIQWSRLFDPNPLVTLLSLASFYCLAGSTRRNAAWAGVFGGLALATKVFYAPVLIVFLLYLVRCRQAGLIPYLAALIGVLGAVCLLGTVSAGTAFWQGLLVQDASSTSLSWFLASVFHVLADDLPLLLLAGAGLWAIKRHSGEAGRLLVWYSIASCVVLGATIKEGTAWPVFQFAEPALALCAAGFLAMSLKPGTVQRTMSSTSARRAPGAGTYLLAGLALAFEALWSLPAMHTAAASGDSAERGALTILQHARSEGRPVIGPPFYLYLAGLHAFGEYADVNLWALRQRRGDAPARALTAQAVVALQRRLVPVVLVDGRVRRLPGVGDSLRTWYRQLPYRDGLPSDRSVTIWVPHR